MHPVDNAVPSPGISVLHVSSAHRVSDGRISAKEAVSLHEAGYQVTVLGLDRAEGADLPAGPEFIEFGAPGSRLRRFVIRLAWLIGYCVKHRYDIYHLHDPDLILLGFVLKLLRRHIVYDAHESYPRVVLDREWIPRLLRPPLSYLWRKIEMAFVRLADLTVTAHDTVTRELGGSSVVTVHNYPIVRNFVGLKFVLASERPFHVIYHGDLTEQRGLLTMVDAINKVDLAVEPVLRLAGSISPDLEHKIADRSFTKRTDFLGWLDSKRLAEELSLARVGLFVLHPTNNYRVITPNKLYEYMAAGIPVVASDFSHWRDVVRSADCGILVDPLDSDAIAAAISYLLTHPDEAAEMGERARKMVRERYNWKSEAVVLVTAYQRVFGTPAALSERQSA